MKFKAFKTIGETNFEIEHEGADEKAFFGFAEFACSLPSAHPSGATDLRVSHRKAKTAKGVGVSFYEIVCDSKRERFCFGQRTDDAGGGLFPKGWQPMHGSNGSEPEQEDEIEIDDYAQLPPAKPTTPSPSAEATTTAASSNRPALVPPQGARTPLGKSILALKKTLDMSDAAFLALIVEECNLDADNVVSAADEITDADQRRVVDLLRARLTQGARRAA